MSMLIFPLTLKLLPVVSNMYRFRKSQLISKVIGILPKKEKLLSSSFSYRHALWSEVAYLHTVLCINLHEWEEYNTKIALFQRSEIIV
jgi:hypothetical protein